MIWSSCVVRSEPREALVEAERALLQEALALLEHACPALEERSLLVDALKQLDELFLLVVVGEFNSGKSSVSRPSTAFVCRFFIATRIGTWV